MYVQSERKLSMNRPSPGLRPPSPRRAGRGQGEGRAVSRPAPTDVCGYSLPEARPTRGIPALALLVLCSFSARAFVVELNSSGDPLRWHLNPLETTVIPCSDGPGVHTNVVNPVTKGIRYFLASDAYSAANATAELNAVRASFAQWQAIAGTILKFEDAGLVAPGIDVNTCDDRNVVFWAKNSTLVNGGLDDIRGALAETFYAFFDNNALAEADIVFNGVQYV